MHLRRLLGFGDFLEPARLIRLGRQFDLCRHMGLAVDLENLKLDIPDLVRLAWGIELAPCLIMRRSQHDLWRPTVLAKKKRSQQNTG